MTVIDVNGVGQPFGQEMIKETLDPITLEILPAYGFVNREEYMAIQPKNAKKVLYGIKANYQLNSDMHSALYSKVYSGQMSFLISEQDAKNKLMSTIAGRKLPIEQRIARLMPHELTTILINEIMNLRTKPTTDTKIALEQINKRMTKDKFSALEMGVYYVTLLEQEEQSRRKNRGLSRKLTFFRKGGG